jgi:hypothetical protein
MGDFDYVEQLGSGHVLLSHDLRLEIVTRKRSRALTEMTFTVSPRADHRIE